MGNFLWLLSTVLISAVMYIHPFNGPLSGTTWVSRYQKGKTNLDFTEARDSEWQWRQLGHMQVCTSLQADNHTSTLLLSFLQAGCPSCRPTNSVEALKVWCRQQKFHLSCTNLLKLIVSQSFYFEDLGEPLSQQATCTELKWVIWVHRAEQM